MDGGRGSGPASLEPQQPIDIAVLVGTSPAKARRHLYREQADDSDGAQSRPEPMEPWSLDRRVRQITITTTAPADDPKAEG